MKTFTRVLWSRFGCHFAVLVLLGLACRVPAQIVVSNNCLVPIVIIQATDPSASWEGDPGEFTVYRHCSTNEPVNVYYVIGGTATNGVDYRPIDNWVLIPAGARTARIAINPINLGQTGDRTVALRLAPPPILPPVNYLIGYPSNAVVVIHSNLPPMVGIVQPPDGTVVPPLSNLPVCANARDDGFVASVEFFADGASLGVLTNGRPSTGMMRSYCLMYSNVPAGPHVLTALATDNLGVTAMSPPIHIFAGPPPTNLPPVVRITYPADGAMFRAPVNIPLGAYARDPDDAVSTVEFLDGTNSLGFGQPVSAIIVTNRLPGSCSTNLYLLVWSNAPVGIHPLRAVATDTRGASAVSPLVTISVLPPPPPPTNRPPIVTIVAIDPIAIEGTNCWVWPGSTNPTPTWGAWNLATCRPITNCGPKNASFAVRRYGATNDPLTVAYAIGGSASNGVDYVPLPGEVTIAAGDRAAIIPVIPLDDAVVEPIETVILRLKPNTNLPPTYLVGRPGSAAALIIDSSLPRWATAMLADRRFHLNANGPNGAWFRVEFSADLVNWETVCTSQVVNGSIDFVDPDAAAGQARFYRAVPEASPPIE